METQEAIDNFITYLESGSGLAAHSVRNYSWDIRQFGSFLSKEPLEVQTIDLDRVSGFLKAFRGGGRSIASVNRMKSTITRFFEYLRESHKIEALPFRSLGHEKVVPRLPPPLSQEQEIALWKAASASRVKYLLVQFYLGKGLRLSEALKINLQEVEKGQGVIKVLGKRSKIRAIDITPELREALDLWIEERDTIVSKLDRRGLRRRRRKTLIDKEALFLTKRGWRLSERGAEFLLRQVFEDAGLARLTVHKLRHAFARRMLRIVDVRTLQEMLGHENLGTTQIYTVPSREDISRGFHRGANIPPAKPD